MTPPPTATQIFVIEDDEDIRDVLCAVMTYDGYQARGWSSAVAALAAIDEGATPDLIILDLMMPRMDGWQFRVEQRKRAHVADTPVLVVSADLSSKAAAVDADAFMNKPIDFVKLRTIVGQLLTAAARKKLGTQLRESERLRALGTLVAGVAHEINNPLTFVSGSLELVDRGLRALLGAEGARESDSDRVLKALADARAGTERIASIVRTLSRFAHVEKEGEDVIDLHAVIDGAATLAAAALRGRATLEKRYGKLPAVLGSEARLAQVILNLLVNAAQAIPRDRDPMGRVVITTGADTRCAFVEVSDDGTGIAEDIAARIFEPFFTTKAPGEGTGLGLSISHDIVRAHGGQLTVQSRVGEGTTFRVELPLRAAASAAPSDALEDDFAGDDPQSQSGVRDRPLLAPPRDRLLPAALRARVLVVDDEPLMCMLIARALSAHDVVTATRAEDALARIRGGDTDFDVVFCDLAMRSMSGVTLFEEVARAHLALARRFVFMSGSPSPLDLERIAHVASCPVLEKPFPLSALTRYVEAPRAEADARAVGVPR